MAKPAKKQAPKNEKAKPFDPVALNRAMMQAYKEAMPVLQEVYQNISRQAAGPQTLDPLNISKSYIELLNHISENPKAYWDLQLDFWQKWTHLWHESALKFLGEKSETIIEPEKGDRRFKAPEWQENVLFDFIKQSYLLTCKLTERMIEETQGLSEEDRQKLDFYNSLFANAMSPANFVLTNPEVLKETLSTGGENLVRGFENLIEDFKRGHGDLKISITDYEAFEVGKNLANTPGRVIYQNELMQLIQYEPATEKVFRRPLLLIPPWINKYYILDLREDNSFIKWLTCQGHTVFTISWINPDAKLAQKRFEDYMAEGVLEAMTQIEKATDEPDCNIIGYCLGGTLLAITLAYLKAHGEANKIRSATFLTTLIDFEKTHNMKVFMDDAQLELLDREMAEKGILEAKHLNRTFSLLRANDLIWSFVVNNYLMGKEPFPFDLLYWNDDSTNMPAAMHSFYLRKLYRDNLLAKPGGITMNRTPINVKTIDTPSYFLSTREDHIAPWKATYDGARMLSGQVCFTLAASGHIAGVVNAPERGKYCHWYSSDLPQEPEKWMEDAKEEKGSWWPHWQKWIAEYTGPQVAARKPAQGLEPAPGSYVKIKGN